LAISHQLSAIGYQLSAISAQGKTYKVSKTFENLISLLAGSLQKPSPTNNTKYTIDLFLADC